MQKMQNLREGLTSEKPVSNPNEEVLLLSSPFTKIIVKLKIFYGGAWWWYCERNTPLFENSWSQPWRIRMRDFVEEQLWHYWRGGSQMDSHLAVKTPKCVIGVGSIMCASVTDFFLVLYRTLTKGTMAKGKKNCILVHSHLPHACTRACHSQTVHLKKKRASRRNIPTRAPKIATKKTHGFSDSKLRRRF